MSVSSSTALCQEYTTPCCLRGVLLCVKGAHNWPILWPHVPCPKCGQTYTIQLKAWSDNGVKQFSEKDYPDLARARPGEPFWWHPVASQG